MKFLKSHVFWFVVLGIVIFVIDEQTSDPLDTIVVDAALERQVAALWAAQVQREPTEAEIASLVDDWVAEEIWRRESIRLSLDEEDEIIRRRMIQKMQFIAEQEAELTPTEEELRAYFEANQERYEVPSSVSFEQLQFHSRDAATECTQCRRTDRRPGAAFDAEPSECPPITTASCQHIRPRVYAFAQVAMIQLPIGRVQFRVLLAGIW